MKKFPFTATECTAAFSSGEISALEIATATLERITQANPSLNAFIEIHSERAITEANALDKARMRGEKLATLSAVPYAVKNLFDVKNITTLAGAKLHAKNPPAKQDAKLIRNIHAVGGIFTGTLNMDAYAYGFTTENTHFGATHNPRDLARSAGGSSGGTGAAIAAGLVPIGLASDTNGSIRVPSSLCGVFGLKPTFGRLSRSGTLPFVASLDHLGPLATTTQDLALAYDAMQGADPNDHACAQKPVQLVVSELPRGIDGLRIARLTGYFDEYAGTEARWAAQITANAFQATEEVELPGVAQARAAAYLITAAESGALYKDALSKNIELFEPLSLERLIAGSLLPAAWYQRALRYRQVYYERVMALFEHYDLLIAPATPVTAPLLGQPNIKIGSNELATRPNMGLLTQPISFIGLPVAVAPLWPGNGLPIGVQLIAPPWREDICLRAAFALEEIKLASSRINSGDT
jgi:aspartyl-tRNA(Asn)/glutamyl-tRNA(Gln) amidotransferase subunit A